MFELSTQDDFGINRKRRQSVTVYWCNIMIRSRAASISTALIIAPCQERVKLSVHFLVVHKLSLNKYLKFI